MNPIVLKYAQLFCMVLFFENVSCDNLSLKNSRDDLLLNRETACTAACMARNVTAILSNCYEECKVDQNEVRLQETSSNETTRLICRESDSLIIEIIGHLVTNNMENQTQRQYNGLLFMLKLQEINNASSHRIVYITDTPIIQVENLQRNTTYNVIASIFTDNFEYRHLTSMETFKTLDIDDYEPQAISNDTIQLDYTPNINVKLLKATIKWKATDDMTCNYRFNLYSSKHNSQVYRPIKPSEMYHLELDSLEYEVNYTLEIYGNNAKNEDTEGQKTILKFTTPPCWQILGYNLQECPPLPLQNINSRYEMIGPDNYEVNVTWDKPDHCPTYYNVTLNMNSEGNITSLNVSGMENHAYFHNVSISDKRYDVLIEAYSPGGHAVNTVDFNIREVHSSFFLQYKQFLAQYKQYIRTQYILTPLIALLCIAFIFVMIQNRRNRLKHKKKIFTNELNLRKMIQSYNKDEMEIDPANVELHELLGEGAFGIVRRGVLRPGNKEIAVKMLKENANIEDIKGFLSEIMLMKSVGHHENIVGIVGHSTKLYNKMMLLTEYCSEGNLLDYLRKFREMPAIDKVASTHTGLVTFPLFEKSPEDIFNFDTKIIDKYENQDKSILFTDFGHANVKPSTMPTKTQHIIFNQLYDDIQTNHKNPIFFNVHFHNDLIQSNTKYDLNEKTNHMDQLEYFENASAKASDDEYGETVRLAENQGYDLVTLPQNSQFNGFYGQNDQHIKSNQLKYIIGTEQQLTGADLLSFAKQIATGMEFLTANKIVHRDLAARNVLVCGNKTVKIADFGLSRDVYIDNIYMKSSAGRLPIKWLALESMTDQKYSSQSDVWSYGILLFEIVTMGCTPYPTVPVDCLINYLKSGNRMSKPFNCSQEFYNLMLSCWHYESEKRPTFADISQQIDWFIQHPENSAILPIVDIKKSEWSGESNAAENTSSTSYLKPF